MAIDLSNVTSITIPEGEVIEISINGTTVWSAGPSPYIWTTIDNTSRTVGSDSIYSNITEFATIPTDAIGLRLTLSYSQTPNSYTWYGTDITSLTMASVSESLANMPTTIKTDLDAQYLFAIRYRRSAQNMASYMCYWYLNITDGNKLNLIRSSYASITSPSTRVGLYPITITKVEALIPNPDLQA